MTQHQADWAVAGIQKVEPRSRKKISTRPGLAIWIGRLLEVAANFNTSCSLDNGTSDIRTCEGQDTIRCGAQQSWRVLKVNFWTGNIRLCNIPSLKNKKKNQISTNGSVNFNNYLHSWLLFMPRALQSNILLQQHPFQHPSLFRKEKVGTIIIKLIGDILCPSSLVFERMQSFIFSSFWCIILQSDATPLTQC